MKGLSTLALMVAVAGGLWASGQTEDPLEQLTKTWTWDKVTTLEIAGEVEFTLVQGPEARVTVTTSRALFDQLSVYNWWGWAGVVVESGLKGPRERGTVKVTLEIPSLNGISVRDHSVGTVTWPGTGSARILVVENSVVTLSLNGGTVDAEVSWFSQITLAGTTPSVIATARHQSTVDARDLGTSLASVALDEKSVYYAGKTGQGTASIRHGSQLDAADRSKWTLSGGQMDEGNESPSGS